MIEALMYEWGSPPSYVQLFEQEECEIISFYNNFSTNVPSTEMSFVLNEHQIVITHNNNGLEDTIFIVPRAGTYLDQDTITIPEYTEGSITACPLVMF